MYSKEDIDQRLHGQWKPVLKRILGLSEVQLTSKGQPCPSCGGEDRYSFTDYQGRGDYFCRGCGPGDGWSLIQKVKKVDFK
jgi:putative DNA primase/helicase